MRSTTAAVDKTDKIAITLPRSILQKIEKDAQFNVDGHNKRNEIWKDQGNRN